MSPALSVVIPTFQRCTSVERLLRALTRQTLPAGDFEVVVSIDGSEDGTREMVERFSAPYSLRAAWQANQGRAGACNAGIRAAQGDFVVIMDDDMEPTPGCLSAHLQAHSEQPRLGVMGAVPVVVSPSSPPVVQYMASRFEQHLGKLAQPGYVLRLRDFSTQNFSVRRSEILNIGAFDEGLFKIYGNEDLEMSVRLRSAGVRVIYSPDALALQHYTKDFRGLARDNIAKGRTAVLFARKHPQTISDLKLSTYREGSPRWRCVRSVLLSLTNVWRGTPDMAMLCFHWLELLSPSGVGGYYNVALDYFYWVGAEAALREIAG